MSQISDAELAAMEQYAEDNDEAFWIVYNPSPKLISGLPDGWSYEPKNNRLIKFLWPIKNRIPE